MAISIKTYNEILGQMVRKIIADTPVNDLHSGSVLLTLLEAVATNDFENNTSILNILDLLNLNNLTNNNLDNRGADYGLIRFSAVRGSGFVTIEDTSFVKQSSKLYPIKLPPISGNTTIYINNAQDWASTGFIYIGRDTSNFEGPIGYSEIINHVSYYEIKLTSSLTKDHLISENVINKQNSIDRIIKSSTVVKIPSNNQKSEILYATLRDVIIPAGETKIENVAIVANQAGSFSNAGINNINTFEVVPFTGAIVYNTSAIIDGKDVETDKEFKDRIKKYSTTLAKGTRAAILNGIIGISDSTDNKQVKSAFLSTPTSFGDPSILYIDDGTGFQPSIGGQPIDSLINEATGKEEFLQLTNYPLPHPHVTNTTNGPISLQDGMTLTVSIDGQQETAVFNSSDFKNISAAQLVEIVVAINNQTQYCNCRLDNQSTRLTISAKNYESETIQIIPSSFDANDKLRFPLLEQTSLTLYKNTTKLKQKDKLASVYSKYFYNWGFAPATLSGTLSLSVDNTPLQTSSFSASDFEGTPFILATLSQWASAFNKKFAGINTVATSSEKLQIFSNKTGTSASVEIVGGTLFANMFQGEILFMQGQQSEYRVNKQNGQIRLLSTLQEKDSISAGLADAKALLLSKAAVNSSFNIDITESGKIAEIIFVADSSYCLLLPTLIPENSPLVVESINARTMKIKTLEESIFQYIHTGDYVYIQQNSGTWIENQGLFLIREKTKEVDYYCITVATNENVVAGTFYTQSNKDLKFFRTDGKIQKWNSSLVPGSLVFASIQTIVDSINTSEIGIKASIYKTNYIKITSATEQNGSIAVPIVVGNAENILELEEENKINNIPHVANIAQNNSFYTQFKKGTSSSSFLDRHVCSPIDFSLSATSSAVENDVLTLNSSNNNIKYSDIVYFMDGGNQKQDKPIRSFYNSNGIILQDEKPNSLQANYINDKISILNSSGFAHEDYIIFVLDQDSESKTIKINMSRNGQVNNDFISTNNSFSANDIDNANNITFGDDLSWSKINNKTDFANYKIQFQARNWISSNSGVNLIARSNEFGLNGEKTKFSFKYPQLPNLDNVFYYENTPVFLNCYYSFGSGAHKNTGLAAGDKFSVINMNNNIFKYKFTNTSFINLSSIQPNDIIAIKTESGVSIPNSGTFRIQTVDAVNKEITLYNENGIATYVGTGADYSLSTIQDYAGVAPSWSLSVGDVWPADFLYLDNDINDYFLLQDINGSVGVWIGLDGDETPPTGANPDRWIKVPGLTTSSTREVVAQQVHAAINADSYFEATLSIYAISITSTDKFNRASSTTLSTDWTSNVTNPWTFSYSIGQDPASLNSKYFILYSNSNQKVCFWYNIGGSGTIPSISANIFKEITAVLSGATAEQVAIETKTAIENIPGETTQLTVDRSSNILSIQSTIMTSAPSVGTSGFTINIITLGTASVYETVSLPSSVYFYPLTKNTLTDINTKINLSDVLNISTSSSLSLKIEKELKEETSAVGYGHSVGQNYILLFDGEGYVKDFSNANPHFSLKQDLLLSTINPSSYLINTAINIDGTFGEKFKLIPTTMQNCYHHFTQKALSQLPIVADIDQIDGITKLQIKSKLFGSEGTVEVVGGPANSVEYSIHGETEKSTLSGNDYLMSSITAYPNSLNINDNVLFYNTKEVERLNKLNVDDIISVEKLLTGNKSRYVYSGIDLLDVACSDSSISQTDANPYIFTITWTTEPDDLNKVKVGDLLVLELKPNIYSTYYMGNFSNTINGQTKTDGFVVLEVGENHLKYLNPIGHIQSILKADLDSMFVYSSPYIEFKPKHEARVKVESIVINGGYVEIMTETSHNFEKDDLLDIETFAYSYSGRVVTASYFNDPAVEQSGNKFRCRLKIAVNPLEEIVGFLNSDIDCYIRKTNDGINKFIIEKYGQDCIYKLKNTYGPVSNFIKCGICVDDYIKISGSTFSSENNGLFKILALTENEIVFQNPAGKEDKIEEIAFNNFDMVADWTIESNLVVGATGIFNNVNEGDWIKKNTDGKEFYRRVVAKSNTTLTLDRGYEGKSGEALGVIWRQQSSNIGKILQNIDDIRFFEGDSLQTNDTLYINNFISEDWFSSNNFGSYSVLDFGLNKDFKFFIEIENTNALSQSSVSLSIKPGGVKIIEGENNKFTSIKEVSNISIDVSDENKRKVYCLPCNRSYKFNQNNQTKIKALGKLEFSTIPVVGIDGYKYYTGLLRTVQRTIDGYEPNADLFPGQGAVGSVIDILPPLIKKISMNLNITTFKGVNLNDITNQIKTNILSYVNNLKVGEDVILSQIIYRLQEITGIEAITITDPSPSSERISVGDNEKAYIDIDSINIA